MCAGSRLPSGPWQCMWGRLSSSLFICAGDISGDNHASRLVSILKERDPDLKVWGVGGPELEKQGAELLFNSQDLTVIGIVNVLKMLPMLGQVRSELLRQISERKPDAVLLVDYGGFNLNLAGRIRAAHPSLPIVYFISPQVWGSRPWRINNVARSITKMMVIFPFEETLYRSRNIDAHFVGHPITEQYQNLSEGISREDFCAKHGLDAAKPIIGIFPGSRVAEIKSFMPVLLQAATWLRAERPDIQFVMSQANPKIGDAIYAQLVKSGKTANAAHPTEGFLKIVTGEDNRALMASSDILWTKSGTTTLEAAFMERPMIVYYRGDWISFPLFILFKRVKYVSWPNLLAGRMLVPELFQLDCRAEQLVRYTRDLLDVPAARESITRQLRDIKSYLTKGDFAANAAEHMQAVLDKATMRELKVAD
jgi:lipid-A-disaccharide synthase